MKNQAVVFGLFETGLGVIRSLGIKGIRVIGVDYKKDIAYYSKYVDSRICPHPIYEEESFLKWVRGAFDNITSQIPIFITSDDFLQTISKNRDFLSKYFLFNIPDTSIMESISDKYSQYLLSQRAGINLPKTVLVKTQMELSDEILNSLNYPVFIKGSDVNLWREMISGSKKGFVADNKEDCRIRVSEIVNKGVPILLQEIIKGKDTNHFKYCVYTDKNGQIKAEFNLMKIRQNPIHFGVGAVVKSLEMDELTREGRKLFNNINFRGIGSAEFKIDDRDGKLKLIEINPRYWQQNYLSTYCGINFPHINYLDLIGVNQDFNHDYKLGVSWVNRYMDFDSYLMYRKEGLTFREWRKSLKGEKIYSDFIWNDPIPALYELNFGLKLLKIPYFILKRIF